MTMKQQFIFLGAPGAGKGTQASILVEKYGLKHISTGNLLRNEITSNSPLGKRVKTTLDKGKLVDDETVLELLKANCNLEEDSYVFDGLPRNINQAKSLDKSILKEAPSKAFYFRITTEYLLKRLVNRRNCDKCGEIFNLITKPPKQEGVCDKCGHTPLVHRKDDKKEVVEKRLTTFHKEIDPIIEYYKSDERLIELDASQDSDRVSRQMKRYIS